MECVLIESTTHEYYVTVYAVEIREKRNMQLLNICVYQYLSESPWFLEEEEAFAMPYMELLVLLLHSICYFNFFSVFAATILWRIKMIIIISNVRCCRFSLFSRLRRYRSQ